MQIFTVTDKKIYIPFVISKINAGFPSPAEGYEECRLDINDIVITHPDTTFYVKVKGESMIDANIRDGDILVVDKSVEPRHNSIVIAIVNNQFTVKTLYCKNEVIKLIPANPNFPEICFKGEEELNIWGVVKYIIHKAEGIL
ncbi:MAG TPA: translesion error-prone DNA polymerase V autoproteolytic subunit [Burkholderiales bacterium]|nr:translesion error-prone DNA polymerase V autoproteolytic subunit [Burkholderiales bacterium]